MTKLTDFPIVVPDHGGGWGNMSSGEIDRDTIRLVRTFNRQLVRKLRPLDRILSGTGLNVSQGNILCEIASSGSKSWLQLADSLLIDKGLLSRNLKSL